MKRFEWRLKKVYKEKRCNQLIVNATQDDAKFTWTFDLSSKLVV